jgi:hypothetical protein
VEAGAVRQPPALSGRSATHSDSAVIFEDHGSVCHQASDRLFLTFERDAILRRCVVGYLMGD